MRDRCDATQTIGMLVVRCRMSRGHGTNGFAGRTMPPHKWWSNVRSLEWR